MWPVARRLPSHMARIRATLTCGTSNSPRTSRAQTERAYCCLLDGGAMPLYLTEPEVVELMNTDPMLYGAVDALEQAFVASVRGVIATPQEERLRVVWPPNQNWRPYDKDIRILPAMVKPLGVAGIHLGC